MFFKLETASNVYSNPEEIPKNFSQYLFLFPSFSFDTRHISKSSLCVVFFCIYTQPRIICSLPFHVLSNSLTYPHIISHRCDITVHIMLCSLYRRRSFIAAVKNFPHFCCCFCCSLNEDCHVEFYFGLDVWLGVEFSWGDFGMNFIKNLTYFD
jgi:hypothetical protein